MRNVLALGAVVLFVGSVSVAVAQERGQQTPGFGVGLGVGDISGSPGRVQAFDKNAFLERLSQAETVMGRIFAIDFAQHRLMIETGGVGSVNDEGQEGKAGSGARTVVTLYMNEQSNMEAIQHLHTGDEVYCEAREETTAQSPFGTGHKAVTVCTVYRGAATMAGFGGLGQRPNPMTERGIETNSGSNHAGVIGQVLSGEIKEGIPTGVSEYTGAAPCWNCSPQPGWGDNGQGNKTDYGSDMSMTKPNLVKK
ncbi:MAG TPA: hypothetical protein VGA17_05310 [Nitrospiraceae bacterium]